MNKNLRLFGFCLFSLLLLVLSGCARESEYEACLRESLKNVPERIAQHMIKKSLERFRTMSQSERQAELNKLKANLK